MAAILPKTFIYKVVAGLEIEVDVFVNSGKAVDGILAWFHGGGLLMSNRKNIPHHLKEAWKLNLAVLSFDYRLAPQASMVEICEDVRDAVGWARNDLIKQYPGEIKKDSKLIVGGASAGGYLSLSSGLKSCGVTESIDAIVALYPITNPLGPFFTTKQSPVSYNQGRIITHEDMAEHTNPKSPTLSGTPASFTAPPTSSDRVNLYTYMIQEANLAHLLFVNAPKNTKIEDYIIPKNIDKDWIIPTWILHGDIDDKVGIEQAQSVVEAFRLAGNKNLEYVEINGGAQHGYDYDPKEKVSAMYDFIKSHL